MRGLITAALLLLLISCQGSVDIELIGRWENVETGEVFEWDPEYRIVDDRLEMAGRTYSRVCGVCTR